MIGITGFVIGGIAYVGACAAASEHAYRFAKAQGRSEAISRSAAAIGFLFAPAAIAYVLASWALDR